MGDLKNLQDYHNYILTLCTKVKKQKIKIDEKI